MANIHRRDEMKKSKNQTEKYGFTRESLQFAIDFCSVQSSVSCCARNIHFQIHFIFYSSFFSIFRFSLGLALHLCTAAWFRATFISASYFSWLFVRLRFYPLSCGIFLLLFIIIIKKHKTDDTIQKKTSWIFRTKLFTADYFKNILSLSANNNFFLFFFGRNVWYGLTA